MGRKRTLYRGQPGTIPCVPPGAITRRQLIEGLSAMVPLMMGAAMTRCDPAAEGAQGNAKTAVQYLATVQDEFNQVAVYSDSDAAGNYFVARGRISSSGDEALIPPMDEANTDTPRKGATCIRARFKPNSQSTNWGGWTFLNGTLTGEALVPTPDFGTSPRAGIDLTGATRITFVARSRSGAKVIFFAFGVGWDKITGTQFRVSEHPDTAAKIQIGPVPLGPDWQKHTIPIPAGVDLTRINGGFGWACTAEDNDREVEFDLDEIRYDLDRKDLRGFLVSFQTTASQEDTYIRNVAYSYDNTCAAIAFVQANQQNRAQRIVDAFVYAIDHDRYYTRRVRNAYQGGPLVLFPGWEPRGRVKTVRLPGWYDAKAGVWFEDRYAISALNTGIQLWVCLALLAYYDTYGGAQYLDKARTLLDEVLENCEAKDGKGGFTAGFEGFDLQEKKQRYKSTEHSIDMYPVAMRLYDHTKDERYLKAAEHARAFVEAMWDPVDGHFWTGTTDDGETISKTIDGKVVIPADAQSWLLLALGKDASRPYWRALDFALTQMKGQTGRGISFSTANTASSWEEGTGQAACAAYLLGRQEDGDALLAAIRNVQLLSGGVPATNAEVHFTGFFLSSGKPWNYYRRVAVASTAWLAIAEAMRTRGAQANPYWFGHRGAIPDK